MLKLVDLLNIIHSERELTCAEEASVRIFIQCRTAPKPEKIVLIEALIEHRPLLFVDFIKPFLYHLYDKIFIYESKKLISTLKKARDLKLQYYQEVQYKIN